MLKRLDLKPGMRVKNLVSQNIAEVRGDEERRLLRAHENFVRVRLRMGKKSAYNYPIWPLDNLEIVD